MYFLRGKKAGPMKRVLEMENMSMSRMSTNMTINLQEDSVRVTAQKLFNIMAMEKKLPVA